MNQVTINTKKCNKCNKELPATSEFFSKQDRGLFGLKSNCKECDKDYRKSKQKPIVYKITHIKTQKSYIGQTVKPIVWRVSHHFSTAKNPKSPFHDFIQECNFEKEQFEYIVLEEVNNKDELDTLEQKWIKHYSDSGEYLFNLQSGGKEGYQADETTKEKISKKHKGKTLTSTHAQKIVETKKRNGTFGLGYKHSDESKRKMSEVRAGKENDNLKGSNNGMAKIDEDKVREVIRLLIKGEKPKRIEVLTGVNTKLISSINNKKSWRHVVIEGYEDKPVYHAFRRKIN